MIIGSGNENTALSIKMRVLGSKLAIGFRLWDIVEAEKALREKSQIKQLEPASSNSGDPGKDAFTKVVALILIIWYIVVLLLAYSGWLEIVRKFSRAKPKLTGTAACEPVSIIRPCKGIETEMESCLESCITQDYPADKFEVLFCVESAMDPCIVLIENLIKRYDKFNLKLLVGVEPDVDYYGPNPKINNLSKGFRFASNDIIWVLDSNVWCPPGTLGRSVDSLLNNVDNGDKISGKPVVLTHHVPLAVSIDEAVDSMPLSARLDETFLFTSHAKFYVGFNKVSIAPCVNGKSNLYRRSALNEAVELIGKAEKPTDLFKDPKIQKRARDVALKNHGKVHENQCAFSCIECENGFLKKKVVAGSEQAHHHGIEFFSTYIGEDNMIGTALWDMLGGRTGMSLDAVVQPLRFGLRDNGVKNYVDRRVRWLRVRKYMVLAATLLEPTTESLVAGLMGAFGMNRLFGVSFSLFMLTHFVVWCTTDWIQYCILSRTIFCDTSLTQPPQFLEILHERRSFPEWLLVWLLRETLALPIWVKAMCGSVIQWRNKPFKIKSDLTAEEMLSFTPTFQTSSIV
ncbi:LAMI_0E14224g1_1 [Lachancea mirantina]|uniref:Ceramide glucosyltransferase n=1 Tax=Lachancea mirantina TaxID=1230905 RepID=A0A1G4JRF0_9SACH|nr:LAMI_0E14224g1_1 [Lachancea mirantina]